MDKHLSSTLITMLTFFLTNDKIQTIYLKTLLLLILHEKFLFPKMASQAVWQKFTCVQKAIMLLLTRFHPTKLMPMMKPKPELSVHHHGNSCFSTSLTCYKSSSHRSHGWLVPTAGLTLQRLPNSDVGHMQPTPLLHETIFLGRDTWRPSRRGKWPIVLDKVLRQISPSKTCDTMVEEIYGQLLQIWLEP